MTIDPWSRKRNLYASASVKTPPKLTSKKWEIVKGVWAGIKGLCTLVGAFVLLFCVGLVWLAAPLLETMEPKQVSLPNQMVLYIPLDGNLGDLQADVSLLNPLKPPGLNMKTFVDALDNAANDSRVKGIYARLEQGGYSIAHIQEMRNAIKRFRNSGKFAYIYSPSYAETGGLGSYYLASAFDEIWMQPMGVVSIAGINAEMPFLRNVLDKVGVEPQFFQRKEYKSAYENLTHANMTPANREMMNLLIGDIAATILSDVAQDRHTTLENFKAMIDKALFMSTEAKKAGLIDEAQYADALVEKINEKVTGDKNSTLPYVDISDYAAGTKDSHFASPKVPVLPLPQQMPEHKKPIAHRPKIALVYAVGMIIPKREAAMAPKISVMGDDVAAADEIAGALLDAADDASIDAVVLRIDSPGGSPVASETILHAVEKIKQKGKSVIVSMGPTAASGGYWIAASADRIFVLPSTLTGSIGVLGGKLSAKALWETLGVNWESTKWGQNSGMWSMNTPFSESEAERMNAMLDDVYVNFIARVAKGRKLTEAEVENIAKGRVWTGRQAIERKLADQIGGLDAALDYTSMRYGANGRHDADIVILPKPLTPVEEFVQMLGGQVMAGQVLNSMGAMMTDIKPILNDLVMIKSQQGVRVYEPVKIQ